MSHSTLIIAFYVSLVLGMSIGITIMIWWAKRILKPAVRALDKRKIIDTDIVGGSIFMRMWV
jgi:hypothetical protein